MRVVSLVCMRILLWLLLSRSAWSFLANPSAPFVTQARQSYHRDHLALVASPIRKEVFPSSTQRQKIAFVLPAKSPGKDEDFEEIDLDVPADWTEDDIAADLGDIAEDLEEIEEDVEVDIAEEEFEDDRIDDTEIIIDDDDVPEDDNLDDIVLELEDEDDDLDSSDVKKESNTASKTVDDYGSEDENDPLYEDENLWEEDDEDSLEILDNPGNPFYMKQKELVLADIAASLKRAKGREFNETEFILSITPEQAKELNELPFFKEAEEAFKSAPLLTEEDLEGVNITEIQAESHDFVIDEPYPRLEEGEVDWLYNMTGVKDSEMEKLDSVFKEVDEILQQEPYDQIMTIRNSYDWSQLDDQTKTEMFEVLRTMQKSSYNVTNWLVYDLGFNVSNLLLAAVKHNPNAPIIFSHWYPQLTIYERYQHARDRDYDFNWDDVDAADISELERYYKGFGYREIPKKAPAETGIISFEDLDEDEIKMAAFESWIKDVYNPDWDKKDFDDDSFTDEDNVFSDAYIHPRHPDMPELEDVVDEYDQWQHSMTKDGGEAWKNQEVFAERTDYTIVNDEEFKREFRGHLIVACSGADEDLDIAEKITQRFKEEFGKKVFVETRLMALAQEEDNVFEVWLESYEIELLHSKRRATSLTDDWEGPAECDDKQIEWLVDEVRFLISDEARYSYPLTFERTET